VIAIDNHLIINTLADPLTSNRAVPVEDFKGMEYDADYYVENQVLPAVMRIMEVLGYKEDDLRFERAKQVKLAEFVADPKIYGGKDFLMGQEKMPECSVCGREFPESQLLRCFISLLL